MDVEKMLKRLGIIALGLCVALMLVMAPVATAAPLFTGQTQFPAPQEPDPVGATQLFTTGPVLFSAPGAFSGSLTSTVFTNDSSNPFGLDRMTFVYQLSNDAGSANAIARLAISPFDFWMTDTSYQGPPPAGTPPAFIDRVSASVIGFSFSSVGFGPLQPGTSSALLVVQTDAPAFQASSAAVIDSGQASDILVLTPFVPEPASLGLLAIAGVALLRRR